MAVDVEQTEAGEVIGTGNDARVALLERINDQNDGLRADELVDIVDIDKGEVEPFVPAEVPPEEPTEEPAPLETLPEPTAQPVIHKIKINGVEKELTYEELVARAQKVEAADTYLAEAARIRREAEVASHQPVHPQGPSSEEVASQRQEEFLALARAIQMGTEEEAVAALNQWQKLNASPSITPDDLARTVDERLTFKGAVARFQTEFQDIVSDPVLVALATQRDQELVNQGDKRDYYTRYAEIGTQLRTWKSGLIAQATPPAEPIVSDKQARKASVPNAPKPASAKAPVQTEQEEPVESASQVIANMAKSRGGPQWMRS